ARPDAPRSGAADPAADRPGGGKPAAKPAAPKPAAPKPSRAAKIKADRERDRKNKGAPRWLKDKRGDAGTDAT
ncbi:ATP-dependent helicase, partial [Cohnella sp. REN36]|nr:ATP-dependent helicase [Cohnella sp. REN36]